MKSRTVVAGVEQSRRKPGKLWKTLTFSLENSGMDTDGINWFQFSTKDF